MRKAKFGYCAVTADLFHIGHLNFLKQAKKYCQNLIVGVMTDDCVKEYKGYFPLMSTADRIEIIKSLSIVHKVFPQSTYEFPHSILRLKAYWGKEFVIIDSKEHKRKNAKILIGRTKGVSSTMLKDMYA